MIRKNKTNQIYMLRFYKRERAELLLKMGYSCNRCGSDKKLLFHHPFGKNWKSEKVNVWTRIKQYKLDYEAGNLELLCLKCHEKEHKKNGNGKFVLANPALAGEG